MMCRRVTVSVVMAGCLGAAAALMCVIIFFRLYAGQRLPNLTVDRCNNAWEQWEESGPRNYDMEVMVNGRQGATYRVEVRQDQIISATRNGYPLKGQRTIGTWSVPGMFGTMEIDLDRREEARMSEKNGPTELLLSCLFDPQYGYPAQYRRVELGAQMQVEWQVMDFAVQP